MALTLDQFYAKIAFNFGPARAARQSHTIQRCTCGADDCDGWRFDPGYDDFPDNSIFSLDFRPIEV